MKDRNLIDTIALLIIFLLLFLFTCYLSAENTMQAKKINELTNKVHQQIELIDALQQ